MTYRIKVIEYESGRKEYVPQVMFFWIWWNISLPYDKLLDAMIKIHSHKLLYP